MKKITYILVAILILTISFEPLSNIYYGSTDTSVGFGDDTSNNLMLDVNGANITVNDVVGASILINE